MEFIEEVFPILEIKEPKKKGRKSLPVNSMLKFVVYTKIQKINRISIIVDMARYHDINTFAMTFKHQNNQTNDIGKNASIISKYYCK